MLQWSTGSYLEDQDMWWLPGIARPVYLLPKPTAHITDYSVTPMMAFTSQIRTAIATKAELEIVVYLEKLHGSIAFGHEIQAEVLDRKWWGVGYRFLPSLRGKGVSLV